MSKATTTRKVNCFRLPRPLWRKLKKCLPKKSNKKKKSSSRRGGRPRASDRAASSTASGTCSVDRLPMEGRRTHRDWFGVSSSVIHERFQSWTRMGIFEKLMRRMVEYYAKERAGIGWRWQAMDSKSSAAPLGGEKTGKSPTDGGKRGAKINLLVDERGAPISVVLTGANRHDKMSAIDPIVSMLIERPARTKSSTCAPTRLTTPPT
jgi:putative transposase